LKCSTWFPAKVALQLSCIGECVPLITGPGFLVLLCDWLAADLFEAIEDIPDTGGLTPADVIDFAHVRLDRPNCRTNTVIDVGVAADLQPIAKNRHRLALKGSPDEQVITHVRPLPGAVDGEIAQDDQR